jgi:hypothetical protein
MLFDVLAGGEVKNLRVYGLMVLSCLSAEFSCGTSGSGGEASSTSGASTGGGGSTSGASTASESSRGETASDAGGGDAADGETGAASCGPTLEGQSCPDGSAPCSYPGNQCRCASDIWICSLCADTAPPTGASCADITSVCAYDGGATMCTCGGPPLSTWTCTSP